LISVIVASEGSEMVAVFGRTKEERAAP